MAPAATARAPLEATKPTVSYDRLSRCRIHDSHDAARALEDDVRVEVGPDRHRGRTQVASEQRERAPEAEGARGRTPSSTSHVGGSRGGIRYQSDLVAATAVRGGRVGERRCAREHRSVQTVAARASDARTHLDRSRRCAGRFRDPAEPLERIRHPDPPGRIDEEPPWRGDALGDDQASLRRHRGGHGAERRAGNQCEPDERDEHRSQRRPPLVVRVSAVGGGTRRFA